MLNQVDWYIRCIIMTNLKTNVNGLALVSVIKVYPHGSLDKLHLKKEATKQVKHKTSGGKKCARVTRPVSLTMRLRKCSVLFNRALFDVFVFV